MAAVVTMQTFEMSSEFYPCRYLHDGSEVLLDCILLAATDGINSFEFNLQVQVSVRFIRILVL